MSGAHKTYVADWRGINTAGEWRGQYSSEPRGLFYAVTAMRRGLAQGTLTRARHRGRDGHGHLRFGGGRG